MKNSIKIIVLLISIFMLCNLSSCNSIDTINSENDTAQQITKSKQTENSQKTITSKNENVEITDIQITLGEKSYTVKMYDNASAKELIDRLPITIEMQELNGNEKYYYFENDFPTNEEVVKNIKSGELMLYGSDCLVLFYKDFSTSYNYTRLGVIEDPSALAEDVGKENITVTLKKQVC